MGRGDRSRETGPALESHFRFVAWLIPTVERFPRRGPPLTAANLGLEKLRFLCRLARELRYLDPRRYEHAARQLDETGRLVGGWRKAHHARESA